MTLLPGIFALIAFLGYLGATISYMVFAPWNESRLGRWLAFELMAITATFALVVVLRFSGTENPEALRAIIYGCFAIAGNGLFYAILRAQLKNLKREERLRSKSERRTAMAKQRATMAVPSSQVQFPNRSVLRTAVQSGIPAFLGLVVLLPWIIEVILAGYGESLPAEVRVWMLGFAGFITVTAGIVAKIMANPAVDAWIREHIKGLAPSAPVDAPEEPVVIDPDEPVIPAAPAEPAPDFIPPAGPQQHDPDDGEPGKHVL